MWIFFYYNVKWNVLQFLSNFLSLSLSLSLSLACFFFYLSWNKNCIKLYARLLGHNLYFTWFWQSKLSERLTFLFLNNVSYILYHCFKFNLNFNLSLTLSHLLSHFTTNVLIYFFFFLFKFTFHFFIFNIYSFNLFNGIELFYRTWSWFSDTLLSKAVLKLCVKLQLFKPVNFIKIRENNTVWVRRKKKKKRVNIKFDSLGSPFNNYYFNSKN